MCTIGPIDYAPPEQYRSITVPLLSTWCMRVRSYLGSWFSRSTCQFYEKVNRTQSGSNGSSSGGRIHMHGLSFRTFLSQITEIAPCFLGVEAMSISVHTGYNIYLQPRPLKLSLGDEPSLDEMTAAPKGMPYWKAIRPDDLPPELQNIDHPAFAQCFHNILVNILGPEVCA